MYLDVCDNPGARIMGNSNHPYIGSGNGVYGNSINLSKGISLLE